jgi:heme-degrading monooxygenase HmoA
MPYVRITIARPLKGAEERLEEVLRKLTTLTEGQDGYLSGWVLRPHDGSEEIARIAIYVDEHAAERVLANDTLMALRSEVSRLAAPGHEERAFFTI